jgi:hypothetical protein
VKPTGDTIPAAVMVLTIFYMLAQAVSIVARILRDRVARDGGRCESWRSSRP